MKKGGSTSSHPSPFGPLGDQTLATQDGPQHGTTPTRDYFSIVSGDWGVGGIARQESQVPARARKHLDRGLAVQHGGNDLTVFRGLLAPYDYPVTVTDGCLNH